MNLPNVQPMLSKSVTIEGDVVVVVEDVVVVVEVGTVVVVVVVCELEVVVVVEPLSPYSWQFTVFPNPLLLSYDGQRDWPDCRIPDVGTDV